MFDSAEAKAVKPKPRTATAVGGKPVAKDTPTSDQIAESAAAELSVMPPLSLDKAAAGGGAGGSH